MITEPALGHLLRAGFGFPSPTVGLSQPGTQTHSSFSFPIFTAFLSGALSFLNQIVFPIFSKSCMWG